MTAGRHRRHGPGFILLIGLCLALSALALVAGTTLAFSHAPPRPAAALLPAPTPVPVRYSPSSSPAPTPGPAVYVVQPGDNLWGIAQAQCGNGLAWQPLYTANQAVIGPDPTAISAGMHLVLSCGPYYLSRPRGEAPP